MTSTSHDDSDAALDAFLSGDGDGELNRLRAGLDLDKGLSSLIFARWTAHSKVKVFRRAETGWWVTGDCREGEPVSPRSLDTDH
ncbi:MAG: hypothetical protein JWN52_4449 [Actinomycetia bacterium]|nr:hypothetical protein [Actinomycetes bacterium]